MIYSLRGPLLHAEPGFAVIECGGVGYRCFISLMTLSQLPPVKSEVMLYTYMAVRDDSVDLYGFADLSELSLFKLLTSVNGVGSKVALALLSDLTIDSLTLAIASGDDKTLTRANGVGKKIAQRIVLELKDKLGAISNLSMDIEKISSVSNATSGALSEAIAALYALGYNQSEATVALSSCPQDMGVEQMIKTALKQLAKRTY